MASDSSYGNNGLFILPINRRPGGFIVIASDGMGWEHISISVRENGKSRTPTWDECCRMKAIFWDEEDCVIQYHPPKSEYINNHPNCLHLWRPVGIDIPMPPKIMVGVK